MSEENKKPSVDELKRIHDIHVTIVQVFTQKVQWYFEELNGVNDVVEYNKQIIKQLREQIEALEPKESDNGEGIPAGAD